MLGVVRDGHEGEDRDYSEKVTITLSKLLPDFSVTSFDIQPTAPSNGTTVTLRAVV